MTANEDFSEQCDEIVTGPFSSKNWLKPAGVSLSRLDQVKPSVYNVGLTDFRELRATSLQGRVKRTESNTELSHDPDLSRNAWCSSMSIPDLMKQHNVIRRRPESAKQPPRVRPPSGRKMRPQSAKDSLSPPNDSEIKVKGAKYDPSSRPPKCSPPQLPGWIDHQVAYKLDPQPPNKVELPAGYQGYVGGLAPPPSPRTNHSDERIAVDQELDNILKEYSNAAPEDLQIRRRTTPEPIHFSLPNVLDEDEEYDSDFDTERLIQEAEMQIKKPPRQAIFHRKPGFSYVHADLNNDGPIDITDSVNNNTGTVVNGSQKLNVTFIEKDHVTVEITPRNSNRRLNNRSVRHGRRDLKYVKSRTDTGLGNRTFNAPKAVDAARDQPLENLDDFDDALNINFAQRNDSSLKSNSNERITAVSSFANTDNEVHDKARTTTPIASVIVNYYEDDINDDQLSMSQKSFIGKDQNKSRPQSGTICKSTKGKNYYELLRNEALENNHVDENCSVFKTTTTMELTDDVESQEIKTRNALEVQKQHPRPTSALGRPVSGHRKTRKSSSNKGDNSDRPGSRLGFVAMAPSNCSHETKQTSSRTGSHIDTNLSCFDDNLAETNRQSDLSDFDETHRQVSEASFDEDTPAREEMKASQGNIARKSPGVKMRKIKTSAESRNHSIAKLSMRKQRSLSAHAICHGHSESSSSTSFKHNLKSHERPIIHTTHDSIHYNNKMYDKYTRAATSVRKPVVKATEEPIIYLNTRKQKSEYESDGIKECKRIQERLSEKGVSITIETLKRALLPPGDRSSYYEIDAGLPRNPADNLLSGPQTWLPEEFKRLKLAEKTLAHTKLSLYYQKLEEDRSLRLSMSSAVKKKKKRKGKKRVVKKSNNAS